MRDLKLESLRIQNFRTFRDLTIDRLGRVNLVVGKNNVGKTSLLEAINFYASYESQGVAGDIVAERDLADFDTSRQVDTSRYGVEIPPQSHLIHNRPSLRDVAKGDALDDLSSITISSTPESNSTLAYRLVLREGLKKIETECAVSGERGAQSVFGERVPCVYLRSCGADLDIGQVWDQIEQTEREEAVIEAMGIIEEVESIRLKLRKGDSPSNGERTRIPIVKTKRAERPEPMRSLGEGMNRLFTISLALADAAGGLLLVDEIENGLHYSVQPKLWRMIFETAQALDVQVFATTHSLDCIQAFQRVSTEHDEEGVLLSLRRKQSDTEEIVAVPIQEEELKYAVDTGTDVR
jgi:AAA15 family ATPase/GTPase